jgi:predicted metal-dependent phosphotriesterase family hydrolase
MSLTHEHIMSNFGKEIGEASGYDSIKLYNQVIPYLKKLKSFGLNSIFENLIPEMRTNGLTDEDIKQVLVLDPKEAFSIRIRKK